MINTMKRIIINYDESVSLGVSGARVASADMSGGNADLTDAPVSGQKIVVSDIIVSTDTDMLLDLKEETTGTVIMSLYLTANIPAQITPRAKLKLDTADKKLVGQTSASGNIKVTILFFSEP